MMLKKLQEKIAHLETELAQVKEMAEGLKKETDDRGVFKPENEQDCWFISGSGDVRDDFWAGHAIDYDYYEIGNCFPTEQAAKDTVRVLKLVQKARESQDGFVPDWENREQEKRCLAFDERGVYVAGFTSVNITPTLGYWGTKSVCEQFAVDNYDDLRWFFTEYQR